MLGCLAYHERWVCIISSLDVSWARSTCDRALIHDASIKKFMLMNMPPPRGLEFWNNFGMPIDVRVSCPPQKNIVANHDSICFQTLFIVLAPLPNAPSVRWHELNTIPQDYTGAIQDMQCLMFQQCFIDPLSDWLPHPDFRNHGIQQQTSLFVNSRLGDHSYRFQMVLETPRGSE